MGAGVGMVVGDGEEQEMEPHEQNEWEAPLTAITEGYPEYLGHPQCFKNLTLSHP